MLLPALSWELSDGFASRNWRLGIGEQNDMGYIWFIDDIDRMSNGRAVGGRWDQLFPKLESCDKEKHPPLET